MVFTSVADPNFFHPDPGSASKKKNYFQALGHMIGVVYPGSGFLPIPSRILGFKKAPDLGSGSYTITFC
jgi:hypothetical protein